MNPIVTEIFSSTDVSCAALLEEHIFNSFLESKASKDEVLVQLQEFDMMKAGEILLQNNIKARSNEELIDFYKECVTFTNWKLESKNEDIVEELRNLKSMSDGFEFLLGVLKIRILYFDFDEEGLSDKKYVLTILNPGSVVGDTFRKALFDDDVDELADALMNLK